MKLGAFRLKSEEETKFEAPKNGMSLLFKANTSPIKDSVAATIRAKGQKISKDISSRFNFFQKLKKEHIELRYYFTKFLHK